MLSLILISLLNPLVVSGKNLGMEMETASLMTKELNPGDLRSMEMYESTLPQTYESTYESTYKPPKTQYSDRYSAEVEMEEGYEPYKSCQKSEEYSAYNPHGESCTQASYPTEYASYPYGSKSEEKVETLDEALDDLASQKQVKPSRYPKKGKSNSEAKYESYYSSSEYGSNDHYKPKPDYQSGYGSEGPSDHYKPSKPYQSDYSSEEYNTENYEADSTYNKPYKKPYESGYGSSEEHSHSSYGSNSYGKPNEKPYDSTYSEDDYESGYQPDNNGSYYGKPPQKPYGKESTEYSGKGAYPEPYPSVDYNASEYQSKPKEVYQTYGHYTSKGSDMKQGFDRKFPDTNDLVDFN
jgi:hypothetical protein